MPGACSTTRALVTDPRQLDWCEAHCRATAIAAFRREVIATAELALTRLAVTEAGDLPGGASGPADTPRSPGAPALRE